MKFIKWGLKLGIYWLSYLFPRNPDIWVYGGALDNFLDNEKWCFLYSNKIITNKKHIWLSRNKQILNFLRERGLNCMNSTSLKGILTVLRAKVFIHGSSVDDFCYGFLTGGALRCNLWHGIPLKKIGYDDHLSPHAPYKAGTFKGWFIRSYAPEKLVFTTSVELRNIFASAFNVSQENVVIAGYHRTIPFFMKEMELEGHVKKMENQSLNDLYQFMREHSTYKHCVYMPTFRDAKPDFIKEALPDFDVLEEMCSRNHIYFYLKLHRYTKLDIRLEKYTHIIKLDNTMDIYPILPLTDVLITDYSSIFFDYALLCKPIIFYPYDLEEYLTKSREMYFQYSDIAKVNLAYDFLQLMGRLQHCDNLELFTPVFYDKPQGFFDVFDQLK